MSDIHLSPEAGIAGYADNNNLETRASCRLQASITVAAESYGRFQRSS